MTYLLLPSQVEVLQEEVTYATEEVERLTKVLDEQNSLLQASQEQTAQKDAVIHQLEQKVKSPRQNGPKILKFGFNVFTPTSLLHQIKRQHVAVEETIRNRSLKHFTELPGTPKSLPQVRHLCRLISGHSRLITSYNYKPKQIC